jgi:hypothetical protein
MTAVEPPNIAVDVCIDASNNVDLVLWNGAHTTSTFTSTTLVSGGFSVVSLDVTSLFPGWVSVNVNVTGTVVGNGDQLNVVVTGSAWDGYNSATVDANFTIDRNDMVTCMGGMT